MNCTAVFSRHFDLTLRELEKVFAVMVIYYSSYPANQPPSPLLVALLSILKIKNPSVYQSLSKGTLTAAQFFDQVNWSQIEIHGGDDLSLDWAADLLDYCLMSDTELESATDEKNQKARPELKRLKVMLRWNRQKIVSILCAELDRFSLSPN